MNALSIIGVLSLWMIPGTAGYLLLRANWLRRYGPIFGAPFPSDPYLSLGGPLTLFVAVILTTIWGWEPRR